MAAPDEHGPRLTAGTVLRVQAGVYLVARADGTTVEASLRGRLKLEQRTGDRVVAGDRVGLTSHPDGSVTIESVEDRRSQLVRRAPGRGYARPRVIVANADQVIIVVAAASPEPRFGMIDRLLVLAESNELPAAIVVNKTDLAGDDAEPRFAAYTRAGYDVLFTSVKQQRGMDVLQERLCGRESVLTGPSGVGKSSLLNAMEPGLGLRVGEISQAAMKGKHTTVSAQLVPLTCGGYVADTPGLREVGLWGVDPGHLDHAFPEFRPFIGECRFSRSCTHTHEPGCAIREAVEAGDIDQVRYESYVKLLAGE